MSTAGAVIALAQKYNVKLPVLTAVARIIDNELTPKRAVMELMNLPQVSHSFFFAGQPFNFMFDPVVPKHELFYLVNIFQNQFGSVVQTFPDDLNFSIVSNFSNLVYFISHGDD